MKLACYFLIREGSVLHDDVKSVYVIMLIFLDNIQTKLNKAISGMLDSIKLYLLGFEHSGNRNTLNIMVEISIRCCTFEKDFEMHGYNVGVSLPLWRRCASTQ